ncbi:VOC family protein [Streptomyces sp. NPDC050674]|uniref:VOC family protein n=1 Tax=Streptomyces sp. NPDC050674 TaxID=3157216 RepID=UPI0034311165
MIAKLQCVVLDCADVVELSRFYQSLLGGVVNQPDPRWSLGDGWATLIRQVTRSVSSGTDRSGSVHEYGFWHDFREAVTISDHRVLRVLG